MFICKRCSSCAFHRTARAQLQVLIELDEIVAQLQVEADACDGGGGRNLVARKGRRAGGRRGAATRKMAPDQGGGGGGDLTWSDEEEGHGGGDGGSLTWRLLRRRGGRRSLERRNRCDLRSRSRGAREAKLDMERSHRRMGKRSPSDSYPSPIPCPAPHQFLSLSSPLPFLYSDSSPNSCRALDLIDRDATKRKTKAAVGEEGSGVLQRKEDQGGHPMMEAACSTKRKTKAAPVTGKDDPSKGCTTERKAEVEASFGKVADAVSAGGGLAQAENGMWIMPDEEVQFVLSMERDQIPPYLRDSLLDHQAWVRRQYDDNKGVVLLDDEMAAHREEHRKALDDEFADLIDGLDLSGGLPISQWKFSDRYSDFFESDEEEEEEEVVQAPIKTN